MNLKGPKILCIGGPLDKQLLHIDSVPLDLQKEYYLYESRFNRQTFVLIYLEVLLSAMCEEVH